MIKPKTRKEKLLSAIANDAPVTIQPKNREELFLAQIAEKVNTVNAPIAETLSEEAHVLIEDGGEVKRVSKSKVGGGGSVPKPLTYDYMPEGYPWYEKKVIGWDGNPAGKETIEVWGYKYVRVADATPRFSELSDVEIRFTIDGSEIVDANAAEMDDKAGYMVNMLVYVVYDGCTSNLNNGSETEVGPGVYFQDIVPDLRMSYVVSVPIAHKFLPAGYPYKKEETAVLFAKEGIVAESALEEYTTPLGLVVGSEYEVVYNGVSYTCIAGEVNMGATMRYLGDVRVMTEGVVGTGEPFLILDSDTPIEGGMYYWVATPLDGSEAFDMSITGAKTEIVTMSPDLLPPFKKTFIVNIIGDTTVVENCTKEDLMPTFTADEVVEAYKAGYIVNMAIAGIVQHGENVETVHSLFTLSDVAWTTGTNSSVAMFVRADEFAMCEFRISDALEDGFRWTVIKES